jgi:hypothetical protein
MSLIKAGQTDLVSRTIYLLLAIQQLFLTSARIYRPACRSFASTQGRPHDKQNRNCLDYTQNLVMSPRGAQCQDGLTD